VNSMIVEYDCEALATYVSLSEDDPARQVEVSGDTVAVDLDAMGRPVGVEILLAPEDVTTEIIAALEANFPELGPSVASALAGAGFHAA
jgi:uncharacterized protein YuzE